MRVELSKFQKAVKIANAMRSEIDIRVEKGNMELSAVDDAHISALFIDIPVSDRYKFIIRADAMELMDALKYLSANGVKYVDMSVKEDQLVMKAGRRAYYMDVVELERTRLYRFKDDFPIGARWITVNTKDFADFVRYGNRISHYMYVVLFNRHVYFIASERENEAIEKHLKSVLDGEVKSIYDVLPPDTCVLKTERVGYRAKDIVCYPIEFFWNVISACGKIDVVRFKFSGNTPSRTDFILNDSMRVILYVAPRVIEWWGD